MQFMSDTWQGYQHLGYSPHNLQSEVARLPAWETARTAYRQTLGTAVTTWDTTHSVYSQTQGTAVSTSGVSNKAYGQRHGKAVTT